MVSTPAFTGGALSFKGDKKKKTKKKKQKVKHGLEEESQRTTDAVGDDEDEMTDAERKALKKKKERELHELEQVAKKSHRERIEEFNSKLNELTELNDIPRVSAAGNG